jgi:hypothetical protein
VCRGFLALVAVALLTPACGGTPSDSACAQEWNRSSNQDNQQEAAVSGFERAIVYGWTVKSGDRGCSVTFTHGPERPWIAYTRSIDPPNEPGFWDSIEGMRWGADNPEGGPTEVNASLQGDGRVGLE